jgi:hypothetical protein
MGHFIINRHQPSRRHKPEYRTLPTSPSAEPTAISCPLQASWSRLTTLLRYGRKLLFTVTFRMPLILALSPSSPASLTVNIDSGGYSTWSITLKQPHLRCYYVLNALTSKNSAFCPHSRWSTHQASPSREHSGNYMYQHSAHTLCLHAFTPTINSDIRLVVVMETGCVPCEVRTGFIYII